MEHRLVGKQFVEPAEIAQTRNLVPGAYGGVGHRMSSKEAGRRRRVTWRAAYAGSAQRHPHEAHAGDRIVVVAVDVPEAEALVERLRALHARRGVEAHRRVARLPGAIEDGRYEGRSERRAPEPGQDVETLHLAPPLVEGAKGDATDDPLPGRRAKQASARRRIVARQPGELVVEALEAEVEAGFRQVVAQQLPNRRHVARPVGGPDHDA